MAYKFPQTIFDCIRQERQDFLFNLIEIVPGYTFNQYYNIQKIHKYFNSHYYDGDYETINGITRKKVFWNIGKRRATIASKQIDIDTKDFLLISENQATEWNVNLLEKELKAWMQKEKYAKVLNQISEELPIYGSVVLRKTKEGAELIDLRYFFCEQSAQNLKKSRYNIIKHLMTPEAMREMTDWDNVKEAIEKFAVTSTKSYENGGQINIQHTTPEVEVYERFGEVPRSFFENDGSMVGDGSEADDDYVYGRWIVAGIDNVITIATINPEAVSIHAPGIVLFKEQLKKEDMPLKECHFRKTRGRWQGIGIIEDLYEDQRMLNKTKDQEDKAQELASLILFQTATDMVAKNVLTDVDNGEILKATSPINRLDNENKSLGAMENIANAYEHHADLQTFNADMLGGQEPTKKATKGQFMSQINGSTGVFEYLKQDYGLFLQEFIQDLVFPDLEKKIMSPHVLRYSGDMQEMQKIRDRAVQGYLREEILNGRMPIPTQQEYQALVQEWTLKYKKAGTKMWIAIEKDFFKNLDYELSLEVTGEGKDVQTWLSNLMEVFNIVSANPILMENPLLKRILYKMLTAIGMSVTELENAEAEITPEVMDAMIKMKTVRNVREMIDFKDVNAAMPQAAMPMLEFGGINVPQQGQQGGGQPQPGQGGQ